MGFEVFAGVPHLQIPQIEKFSKPCLEFVYHLLNKACSSSINFPAKTPRSV